MTENQRNLIVQKLKGIQPKEIKPYVERIMTIINRWDAGKSFTRGCAEKLINIIFDIRALDRNWSDDLDGAKRNALAKQLERVLIPYEVGLITSQEPRDIRCYACNVNPDEGAGENGIPLCGECHHKIIHKLSTVTELRSASKSQTNTI